MVNVLKLFCLDSFPEEGCVTYTFRLWFLSSKLKSPIVHLLYFHLSVISSWNLRQVTHFLKLFSFLLQQYFTFSFTFNLLIIRPTHKLIPSLVMSLTAN